MSRSRLSRPARGLAVLAVALAALTACSGGDETAGTATTSAAAPSSSTDESPTGSATTSAESETVTATEGEMFIQLSEDSFSAGSHTFEVVNDGSATHDFMVERDGEVVAGTGSIAPGTSTTLTVDLAAGDYVFYCSVANHRAMGMEVRVTVT